MLRNIVLKSSRGSLSGAARTFTSTAARLQPATPDPSQESSTGQYINTITNPYTVTTYARPNLVFTHGKGAYLFDLENNQYIDFSAGIAVTGLGHANPEIADIISKQAGTLIHCSNLFHNLYAGELANKLVTKTKSSGGMHDAQRVFLCNSGTEANEAALKFGRKYGKQFSDSKTEIITFQNAFHGRSLGALSVTPNPKYQQPFSPLIPGVHVADAKDITSVEKLISKEKTCAVIIEPIQGEGGVSTIDTEFLIALKKLCEKNDVLLIYDEIQCGLGRSGKLWAHGFLPKEAHPDILTMAKALGNGFPIGATMITEKVEQALKVGDHGTTYGGNPLGARIGSYVVDQVSDADFLAKVEEKSDKFVKGLNKIAQKYPSKILEVRGKGLLLGLQFDSSVDPGKIATICRENGLIVITAGMNVLRLVPALNIDNEAIENGLEILSKAIDEVCK
ncbi:acetylornithine aminotransferase, mitochondrial [[Candida] railenensis]|uniref:Acetylornithine aminotransferase, mitochondrial n=1 Tax=[Candida] railenensis TaxID=45579 RepID=A0A9P0VXG6_9ASCO|nr:acetylornithine aminotransferase, mitochondrial [[Candida] railenensis]